MEKIVQDGFSSSQARVNWARSSLREGTVMSAISGTQRLLQASTVRVAVLYVLFGLWGFVPLVGADIPRTWYGPGGLVNGGTITALGTANDIAVGLSAGDVFVMDVAPRVDSVKRAASELIAQQQAPPSGPQTGPPSPPGPRSPKGPPSPPPKNCKCGDEQPECKAKRSNKC
jgi:hypothetical protein